jgi:hypothetical protein
MCVVISRSWSKTSTWHWCTHLYHTASDVDPAVVIVGACCPAGMMYATAKLSLLGPLEVVNVMVTDPTETTPVLEHVPSTCQLILKVGHGEAGSGRVAV